MSFASASFLASPPIAPAPPAPVFLIFPSPFPSHESLILDHRGKSASGLMHEVGPGTTTQQTMTSNKLIKPGPAHHLLLPVQAVPPGGCGGIG